MTKDIKNVKPSKFTIASSLPIEIVRQVECNNFAWRFLVSNAESESEMWNVK